MDDTRHIGISELDFALGSVLGVHLDYLALGFQPLVTGKETFLKTLTINSRFNYQDLRKMTKFHLFSRDSVRLDED